MTVRIQVENPGARPGRLRFFGSDQTRFLQRLSEEMVKPYIAGATHVAIEYCNPARPVIDLLASLGTMNQLMLVHSAVSNDLLEGIGAILSLKRLFILHPSNDQWVPDLRHITGLQQLETLSIEGVRHINDEALEVIAQLQTLRVLDLRDTSIHGLALERLAAPPLTSVRLDGCPLVGANLAKLRSATLESIGLARCEGLSPLDLINCPWEKITPRLEEIEISPGMLEGDDFEAFRVEHSGIEIFTREP